MKIASIFGDKFIILFILNIIVLYAPLEKNFPHFFFKLRISLKQIIEGAIGFLDCVIPKYEENKQNKEKK